MRQRQDVSVYRIEGIVMLEILSAPAYRRRIDIPAEKLLEVLTALAAQLPTPPSEGSDLGPK